MDSESAPDWYLREWMAHFKKRQSALVNELGWDKARASYVWHGKIPYRREVVNELAAWLHIQPYELLMPPTEALALRRLRETAKIIADEPDYPMAAEQAAPPFEHPKKRKAVA